jgi:predicted dinucleotide-binding enzyme
VAIIGTGNIGSTLAGHFAAGGQDFLLAGRDAEAARKIAANLDGRAEAVSVDEAVQRADVLVVAVWLPDFEQLIAQYGERLAGKVIVDPTNPVGPDDAGNYRKVIGEQESSGQILAGLLPAGARLVKAFGTLSAPTLGARARGALLRRGRRRGRRPGRRPDPCRRLRPGPRGRPRPVHPHRDVRRPARVRCPGPGRDQNRGTEGHLTRSGHQALDDSSDSA